MKVCRVLLSTTRKFGLAEAKTATDRVEMILQEAREKIKCVQDIEKLQQVCGKINVVTELDQSNSYSLRFRKNGCKLDDKFPRWSHELLYFDAFCIMQEPRLHHRLLVQQARQAWESATREAQERNVNKKV